MTNKQRLEFNYELCKDTVWAFVFQCLSELVIPYQ